MPDLQSGGCEFEYSLGYFAPRSTQPSIPPRSVNEYQLRLGRQRQVWLIPIADERVGVQVKLWNPLRTRAIRERFCGGDSLRRGAISSVCTLSYITLWGKISLTCSLLVGFNGHSSWTWLSRYQNVSILDFIGTKDGGDNWNYKACKSSVKSSPLINHNPSFLQAGCPSCRPTNNVRALKGTNFTDYCNKFNFRLNWLHRFCATPASVTGKNRQLLASCTPQPKSSDCPQHQSTMETYS